MYCDKCGSKVEKNDAFCPKCGNRLASQPEYARPVREEKIRSPRTERKEISPLVFCLLGAVIVLALGLIGFGAFRLLKGDEGKTGQDPEPVVAVETTETPVPVTPAKTETPVATPTATPMDTATPTPTPVVTVQAAGDWMFPDSNSSYITANQVEALTLYEMYLARNEIFARRGRKFKNADLQDYFNSKSWYTPTYEAAEFDANMENIFNEYEKANVKQIGDIEKKYGSPYL